MISNDPRALTITQAKELLQNNTYFKYIDGVELRLHFNSYPRLWVDRYGANQAKKCVELARKQYPLFK